MKDHLVYHSPRSYVLVVSDMAIDKSYMNMLTRACQEIQRISSSTPEGGLLALDLYVDLKINFLQAWHATVLDWAQIGHHTYVTKMITTSLRSHINPHVLPPLTFARYCRMIKERMHRVGCAWGNGGDYSQWVEFGGHCIHDMLVPDLDLFQRYAYLEVRDNVFLALAKRMPAELMMLVFEYIMATEGLPLDPRILASAYNRESVQTTALKSRLKCVHLSRCSFKRSKRSGYGRIGLTENGPEFVVGDEWKETVPGFPHSQVRDINDMIALDFLLK